MKQNGMELKEVYITDFRVYTVNSPKPVLKPGEQEKTLSIRLSFGDPNQDITIHEYIPQLFIKWLSDKGEWNNNRVPIDLYKDDDGEFVAAIKFYNLEKLFAPRSKNWKAEQYMHEIKRLLTMGYWKTSLTLIYEKTTRNFVVNDKGMARIRIALSGFSNSPPTPGHIQLKFTLGNLHELYRMTEINDRLYFLSKSQPRRLIEMTKVNFRDSKTHITAVLPADKVMGFFRENFSDYSEWDKGRFETKLVGLNDQWDIYVVGKLEKLYEYYNFRDIPLEQLP